MVPFGKTAAERFLLACVGRIRVWTSVRRGARDSEKRWVGGVWRVVCYAGRVMTMKRLMSLRVDGRQEGVVMEDGKMRGWNVATGAGEDARG